jgi:hypothetical protein
VEGVARAQCRSANLNREETQMGWAARSLSAIAVGAVLVTPALAQQKPSFAGQWTRELEKPAVENAVAGYNDMGSGWGNNITVTQDASKLVIEYAFFSRGDLQPPLRFVYALDGTATENFVMMGRGTQGQTSKAMWSDNKLVIVTAHALTSDGKSLTSEVKQTLSLDSPTSLVVETTRGGALGGPPTTNRSVYRKL